MGDIHDTIYSIQIYIIKRDKREFYIKQNCWEYRNCGRETNGVKAKELGVCPVARTKELDGTHSGQFAGRACWVATGTLCNGEIQGKFGQKFKNCIDCDFYKHVKK